MVGEVHCVRQRRRKRQCQWLWSAPNPPATSKVQMIINLASLSAWNRQHSRSLCVHSEWGYLRRLSSRLPARVSGLRQAKAPGSRRQWQECPASAAPQAAAVRSQVRHLAFYPTRARGSPNEDSLGRSFTARLRKFVVECWVQAGGGSFIMSTRCLTPASVGFARVPPAFHPKRGAPTRACASPCAPPSRPPAPTSRLARLSALLARARSLCPRANTPWARVHRSATS